jgi:hypothetical protein
VKPTIVQVVPQGEGGVRDFALGLQQAWAGIGQAAPVQAWSAGDAQRQLAGAMDAAAARAAGPGPLLHLLLHFSGYGFAPRGLCGWLPRLLQAPVRSGRLRLSVYFHELYAEGEPPWRSAFWLAPAQRAVAGRMARLASPVLTNAVAHARWLARQRPVHAPPPLAMPVFSCVGEVEQPPPLAARPPRIVVFGSAATRQRAAAGWLALRREAGMAAADPGDLFGRADPATEIVEVGPGPPQLHGPGLPHRHLGPLPATQVLQVLMASRWALLDYPGDRLGKSSVFAACAAAGCLVINTRRPRTTAAGDAPDGALAGEQLLDRHALLDRAGDPAAAQRIADAAHAWYRPHRRALQAPVLLDAVLGRAAPAGAQVPWSGCGGEVP